MTVGTEMCSWVDAEDWRTNEGIKTEQAGYVGAQINTPRHAKDSQGTERPLREKKAPPPARRQRQKKKRAPAAPKGRYEASFNEERRKTPPRPAGLQIQMGPPSGASEKLFSPLYHTPYPPPICKNRQKTTRKFYHSGEKEKFPEMVRT